HAPAPALPSFPTRRSSDLLLAAGSPASLSTASSGATAGASVRSPMRSLAERARGLAAISASDGRIGHFPAMRKVGAGPTACGARSEEHTSELQSRENLVCR